MAAKISERLNLIGDSRNLFHVFAFAFFTALSSGCNLSSDRELIPLGTRDWQMHPGTISSDLDFASPDWKPVKLPITPKHPIYWGTGVITLQKTMPARIGQLAGLKKNLVIDTGRIGNSRIYVDGRQTGKLEFRWRPGRIIESIEKTSFRARPVITVILNREAGQAPREWSFQPEPAIGEPGAIFSRYYQDEAISFTLITLYLVLGVYTLALFLLRPTDISNLVFSIFSTSICLYWIARTPSRFVIFFGIDWMATKAEFCSAFLAGPLVLGFLYTFFRRRPGIIGWVFISLNSAMAIVALLAPDADTMWNVLSVWQLNAVPLLIFVLYVMIREAVSGTQDSRRILTSFGLLVLAVLHDLLAVRGIIFSPQIGRYAFAIVMLSVGGILANRFVRAEREIEAINVSLQRFVPQEFLELLGKKSITEIGPGDSTRRSMTVLFSDIRDFTTISEKMSPEENFHFVNQYLGRMVPLVHRHGGVIDKFIGDAIMALFPAKDAGAIQAAVEMQQELANGITKSIRAGIGIHTGALMLGTIGTERRIEGTVISDAVNLAARLESLTKSFGVRVLVSEETKQSTKQFVYRRLGFVRVKGRDQAVAVYEVLDADDPELATLKANLLAEFESALVLKERGELALALAAFTRLKEEHGQDSAVLYYIEHITLLVSLPEHARGNPEVLDLVH